MRVSALILAALAAMSCSSAVTFPVESFDTPGGNKVQIAMIRHGSLAMDYKGFSIQIDPVSVMGSDTVDYSVFPPADCIFITHEHGDHLSPETIDALTKESTRLYCNLSSEEALGKGEVLGNGNTVEINSDIAVTAVPAYNTTEEHAQFHPEDNGNGYIFIIDGLSIYVSGDTEDIEEMAEFGGIDIAFLSCNQPYTMTVEQCINAARVLSPKVLIPYHLSDTDTDAIRKGLEDTDIEVRTYDTLR